MIMEAVMLLVAGAAGFVPSLPPRDVQEDLFNAEQAIASKEYKDAVGIYLRVMERTDPDWCVEIREEQRYLGVRTFCREQLRSLPSEVESLWKERSASSSGMLRRLKDAEDVAGMRRAVSTDAMASGGGAGRALVTWLSLDEGETSQAWTWMARASAWEEARILPLRNRWSSLLKGFRPAVQPGEPDKASAMTLLWSASVKARRRVNVPNPYTGGVTQGYSEPPRLWACGDRAVVRQPDGKLELVVKGEPTPLGRVKASTGGGNPWTGMPSLPPAAPAAAVNASAPRLWVLLPGELKSGQRGRTQKVNSKVKLAEGEDAATLSVKSLFVPTELVTGEDRFFLFGCGSHLSASYGILNAGTGELEWEGILGTLEAQGNLQPGQLMEMPAMEIVMDESTMAVGLNRQVVMVLDRASGHIRWGRAFPKKDAKGSKKPRVAPLGEPPLLAVGHTAIFGVVADAVVAWDRDTGKKLWEERFEGEAPHLVGAGPGVVVLSTEDGVRALAEHNGKLRWSWKPEGGALRSGFGSAHQLAVWVPFGKAVFSLNAGSGELLGSVARDDDEGCRVSASGPYLYVMTKSQVLAYGPKS